MKTSNHTLPSGDDAPDNPIELTMDAFRPVEPPRPFHMGSSEERYLPYAYQDPRNAARVTVVTPDGSYESDHIHIDETEEEIVIDAEGVRILLDGWNVVVYLDSEKPTIYRNVCCDVKFTA